MFSKIKDILLKIKFISNNEKKKKYKSKDYKEYYEYKMRNFATPCTFYFYDWSHMEKNVTYISNIKN